MPTVTGTLETIIGNEAEAGTIEVALCGYGSQIPRINGAGLGARVTDDDVTVGSDGTFSFEVTGNDEIQPLGTYYTVTVRDDNGDIVQINAYLFLSTQGSYDLDQEIPFNPTNPPASIQNPIPPYVYNMLKIVPYAPTANFSTDPTTGAWLMVLEGDCTPTFTGMVDGNLYTVIIEQDAAQGHQFTWPSNVINGAPIDITGTTTQTFIAYSGQLYAVGAATYIPAPPPIPVFPVPTDLWPVNEGSGTTFNNSANPANPATATNVTWNGNAAQFDGASSYAVAAVNDAQDGTKPLSVSAWINFQGLDAAGDDSSIVSCLGLIGGWALAILGADYSGIPMGGIYAELAGNETGAGYIFMGTTTIVPVDEPVHVCFTYDGSLSSSGVQIYFNGMAQPVAVASSGPLTVSIVGNAPVQLGYQLAYNGPEAPGAFFSGTISGVRIDSVALTAEQVADIFNAGAGKRR